ncbi:hypothetical protein Pfo_022546 [Paulownia fortunei]|nr:hypothetical protein Pfo_022546 [Paulownia fortunei]
MASKLLLTSVRTLTRPCPQLQFQFPQFTKPKFSPLIQSRHYSDSQQPIQVDPAAALSLASNSLSKSSLSSKNSQPLPTLGIAAFFFSMWDAEGPFKPLHVMNPTRLAFIRSTLCRHFRKDPNCPRPFEVLKFVDVGCGGGILSELFYLSQDLDPITSSIDYHCTTAEKLVEEQRTFDAVIALEVIEHVADPADFCKSLTALTAFCGATLISTINRSMRAYATAIVMAEYVLHWLARGTHQWSSFLMPKELVLIFQSASVSVQEKAGFVYNPLTGRWTLSDDISVNFIAYGTKDSK